MIIQVDEKGKQAIEVFCDLALAVGRLKNLKLVNLVVDTMVVIPDPKSKPEPVESKKDIEVSTQLLSEKVEETNVD